jgi:hypothetical protein
MAERPFGRLIWKSAEGLAFGRADIPIGRQAFAKTSDVGADAEPARRMNIVFGRLTAAVDDLSDPSFPGPAETISRGKAMRFLLILLLSASPAAAQLTFRACPVGTEFVPRAQPQTGDVELPGFAGFCKRPRNPPPVGERLERDPDDTLPDSTWIPSWTLPGRVITSKDIADYNGIE